MQSIISHHMLGQAYPSDPYLSQPVSARYPGFNFHNVPVFLSRDINYNNSNQPLAQLKGRWGEPNATYSPELMGRLRDFIKRSNYQEYNVDVGHLWNHNVGKHGYLINLLLSDKLEEAHNYLNLMHLQPVMTGITAGDIGAQAAAYSESNAQRILQRHWDVLLGVCEYLAIIAPANKEQGSTFTHVPIDNLVETIKTAIWPGFEAPKWQGGLYGLDTSLGIFTDRDLMAFYIAVKLHQKFSGAKIRIAEIGPGAGYVIYWLYKLGHRDITMVDLPSVAICQAYQLAANLGEDSFLLPGETGDAPIRMVGPDEFNNSTDPLEVVYNIDSMPEIKKEYMEQYLDTIRKRSKIFFSINQESQNPFWGGDGSQNSVPHTIMEKWPEEFQRIDRSRFWLRDGYVEETYNLPKNW